MGKINGERIQDEQDVRQEDENSQEPQTLIVGNINLHLTADGKNALASCTLFGMLKIEFVIPESAIKEFDEERLAAKKSHILLLPKKGLHA